MDLPVPEQGAYRLDGLLVGVFFVRGVEKEGEQQVHCLAGIAIAVLPLGERLRVQQKLQRDQAVLRAVVGCLWAEQFFSDQFLDLGVLVLNDGPVDHGHYRRVAVCDDLTVDVARLLGTNRSCLEHLRNTREVSRRARVFYCRLKENSAFRNRFLTKIFVP